MSPLNQLASSAGSWHGHNKLQDPITNNPADSPATATLTALLGGRFMRLDYTWAYQGTPQEGSILIGYEAEADRVTAHWINTWHMGDKVMACQGPANPGGEISVRGSYAAPPGPDWGWRITITPHEGQRLGVVMHNIWPEGKEELAVEADYTR